MHIEGIICGETNKSQIVLKHNKTKGGVNSMDSMTHSFTSRPKSKRWPLVIFFNILDLAFIAS